jgi:hypothetical protein
MQFVNYHVGTTFRLSIDNMDSKFTIMAIDHIICSPYLGLGYYMHDRIGFR